MRKIRKFDMKKVVGDKKTDFVNMQIRKFTIPLTKLIAKYTNITPNQLSVAGIITMIISLFFLASGGYWNIVIGSLFVFLVSIFDHLDGKLARVLNKKSLMGHWLDAAFGLIYLPLILLALTIGLKAYFIGLFAVISYPIHFLVCYLFKADFTDKIEKNKVHLVKKESRLRFLYGGHTIYHLLPVASILYVPKIVLLFFAIFGNLFWIALLFMQYKTIKAHEK